MISKFNLVEALRDRAKTTTDNLSLRLVSAGEGFTPEIDESYIAEITLFGDDIDLGLNDNSSTMQLGVYQMTAFVPKNQTRWTALKIIDDLQAAFPRELALIFGGQTVRLKSQAVSSLFEDNTHYSYVLSINYSVIN